MRQVGFLSKLDQAERFADFLRAGGIKCSVDDGANGYRIWVLDDDDVASAKEEWPRFLAEPDHERYRNATRIAKAKIVEEQHRREQARANTIDLSEHWRRSPSQNSPITFGLIAVSIVVMLLTGLQPKHNDPFVNRLWFSTDGTFDQIRSGEVWRLISPIFLHFGLMHIVFNLLWTYQFGLQIEPRRGSGRFLLMVLTIAAASNFAQFWFHGERLNGVWFGNPWFGGMSGVVYGLFGYIWIKGKVDPGSGFGLPQQTVMMMLVWHVLCVAGIIPNVANWAHGVGLVTGMTIAAAGTLVRPRLPRR